MATATIAVKSSASDDFTADFALVRLSHCYTTQDRSEAFAGGTALIAQVRDAADQLGTGVREVSVEFLHMIETFNQIGLEHEIAMSNGLGWSPDQRTFYYVDSGFGFIYAYDVDSRGDLSNRRIFASFEVELEGTPDGLCVDMEGCIWVAVWGGAEVRRYAPSGKMIAHVAIDTFQPSSCAIGGENGTTLYVTTAREDMAPEQLERETYAGQLFCADVGVRGGALLAYQPTLND